ncbi:hypothetical protein EZV62_010103 [Acer yangbiense]|uniref:Cation efflux protein cytoplasmic domain-containing protein n=1 Tax=Acer yangbiense TaxID=1000413 RepID=A0A5C7I2C1_9ROSI|nr:hypothetical protein EZV62_010103 [Acer yangbiense]
MEGQYSQHGQIIETNVDVPGGGGNLTGSKICGEAPCVFSDAGTNSKDAKERSDSIRKRKIKVVLCVVFMGMEVVGGIKANSLSILTDVAHLLLDVAAFAIPLLSIWAAGWESTPHQTYGFFRVETLEISEGEHNHHHHEEIPKAEDHHHGVEHSQDKHDHHHHRGVEHSHDEQHHSAEVHTEPLLDKPKDRHEQKKRRNIYLCVLGDFIQSIGVMIGGAVIWYEPEWKIVDVICTLIFSVIVLRNTIKKLRSTLEVLMESTPREIDATKLEKGLLEMEEVVHIHELHIWAIAVEKVLLACHVKIRPEANADMVLDNVVNYIRREYNISHVTVQIER